MFYNITFFVLVIANLVNASEYVKSNNEVIENFTPKKLHKIELLPTSLDILIAAMRDLGMDNKLLTVLLEQYEENHSPILEKKIRRLLRQGINFSELFLNNFHDNTIEKFRLAWESVDEMPGWEMNNDNLPEYIRRRLRFKQNKNDLDNMNNTIVFCLIHGAWDGHAGKDFYDTKDSGFQGVLKYAENYLKKQNKICKSKKVIHVLSYRWWGEFFHENRSYYGKQLARFLNGFYPNAKYGFICHSFGCGIANETLLELKKLKQIRNVDDINFIAEQLIYIFPPCRQPFFGKFELLNRFLGYSLSAPTNYRNLMLFYSDDDPYVPLGGIDKISGILGAISIGNLFYQKKGKNNDSLQPIYDNLLSFGPFVTSFLLVLHRAKNSFYYQDIKPQKSFGFKNQVKMLIDGKNAKHRSPSRLMKNLDSIGNKFDLYPGHSASSSFFVANIAKSGNVQLFLDTLLNEKYQIAQYFNDENSFISKKDKEDFFNIEDMRYAEEQIHFEELKTFQDMYKK